jgi:hypothetical protein
MPSEFEEENGELSSFWSWIIMVAVCIVIVGWGIFNYLSIPDQARKWDIGALRDVPGQSIYSTAAPKVNESSVPIQVQPLPEGTPISQTVSNPAVLEANP